LQGFFLRLKGARRYHKKDENGKVKPRLVDVNCQKSDLVFRNNLHFIHEKDYKDASEFVKNPEDFDFLKILGWD